MQNLMGLEGPQFLITTLQMLFLAPEKRQLCCLFLTSVHVTVTLNPEACLLHF